jgi:hypothetical protein
MPDILHRITIDAPRDRVHELIATKTGLKRWWTGHPVGGDESVVRARLVADVASRVGRGGSYVVGARLRRHGARGITSAAVGSVMPHSVELARQPCESAPACRSEADLGTPTSAGHGRDRDVDEGITSDADDRAGVSPDACEARRDPHRDRDLESGGSQPLVIRSSDTDEQAVLRERPTSLRRPRHEDLPPLTATARGHSSDAGAGEVSPRNY